MCRLFEDGSELRDSGFKITGHDWHTSWPSSSFQWGTVTTQFAIEPARIPPRGCSMFRRLLIGKKVVFTGVPRDRNADLPLLTTRTGAWDIEKFSWRASVLTPGDDLCVLFPSIFDLNIN